ncbi:VacB/RNase II family 3'-5' exoribonuclease [Sphingomonas sp. SFZ2018-12]|uniref:ribonuclease R family protein n=1 Tax=Sphingomonas sp. SFZ2018-12 TaxID=2683197 RepID=UPI001F0E90BE|nr:VacB/RNase II family 3'-5' exoribonuclease [Sphingomonas sp. SFZ2018-12]MCH4891653.1 VacB/RNase II family 3'-5' exoribonuclease [Sphingomonas sp. SFZ2018-12]
MSSRSNLPTRQQIMDFIASSDQPAGKREIARAFALRGPDKIALKALLKDMSDEGLIDVAPGRAFHKMGGLPKVTVLRIVDVDDGGNVWAMPERWEAEGVPEPRVRIRERGRSALAPGDRVLARTEEAGKGWIAHPMKKLARGEALMLGVVHAEGGKHWLQGVEKKERRDFPISDLGGAEVGDLVLAERAGRPPRMTAKVVERLGDPFAPRSFSLVAIHKHGIPNVFSDELLAEAGESAARELGEGREDLRALPIVAIDPADARDHDDAVWAAPDDDPGNPGGWRAIVAIADVSFYVRPGSLLDREARKRGNSVYFPDRVVPMLPEILSADVCSLKEGVDRAALACHLQVSAAGALKSWRFSRAVVRIVANIAYEDAQAVMDGDGAVPAAPRQMDDSHPNPSPEGEGLKDILSPLWDCWHALNKAREARAPLDLDLPERRIILDEKGRILSVAPRERLDAHKLIEDYMIAANVAAAKALEAKKAPVMYRIHEPPAREKLVALKDYLKTFDIEFALGQVIRPATFNHILGKVAEADHRAQVMEQVLRTQTQAYYGPANHGHFGLALGSYAHFTSPIRRYADLVVHRALVAAHDLGPGGLVPEDAEMVRIGEVISGLERRAMEAERETIDRYVAAYLSEHVGSVMDARITGVQSFGFFATIEGVGGDGLVPARDLGREYFRYDETRQQLVGDETGAAFALGQRLSLRLVEANPVSGALRFELPDGKGSGSDAGRPGRGPRGPRELKRRGRPANIRHQGRKR